MLRRPPALVLLAVLVTAGAACRTVNLAEALKVTDVQSGWYDNGVTKDGKNHLLPTITFRLQNASAEPVNSVQLTVSFWIEGKDGELESVQVRGIGSESVAPGASTEPITVRSPVGYTLEGARADFFSHSGFQDATAKIFAKRGGGISPIGQFRIDRQIIPQQQRDARVP